MMRRRAWRAFTLIELMVVIAIVAILAAILFPLFAQARESARITACLSNMRQIGMSVRMYGSDYDGEFPIGTYPEVPNRQVNRGVIPYAPFNQCADNFGLWIGFNPGDGGPDFTGCAYGGEFYRALMSVQLSPYTRNRQIWYCPSDNRNYPPNAVGLGMQSYHWFPNWIYNGCCGTDVRYPDGSLKNLADDPPSDHARWFSERILFSEAGIYGFDGGDATTPSCEPWDERKGMSNHRRGYNALYFDGHVRTITWGKKWTTLPASGWGANCRPR